MNQIPEHRRRELERMQKELEPLLARRVELEAAVADALKWGHLTCAAEAFRELAQWCEDRLKAKPEVEAKTIPCEQDRRRHQGTPVQPKLELYLWEGVLGDYTDGMAFAVASSWEDALRLASKGEDYTAAALDMTKCRRLPLEPFGAYVRGGG
jgi:hypothetical protein